MDDAVFERLVVEGIDLLPEKMRKRMTNVAIVIEDEPTPAQRSEQDIGENEVLFGLYEGIPQPQRGIDYHLALPDKITIFKKAILDAYTSDEDIRECVANTVWHEVAHHFGYEEEWIAEEERKRGKTL